jgi:hypothetical protein
VTRRVVNLRTNKMNLRLWVVVPFLAYLLVFLLCFPLWQHSPHFFFAGDDAGGFDTPDGFDGAVCGVMWIGTRHCYRSHQFGYVSASGTISWLLELSFERGSFFPSEFLRR